jgi:hypothetical protein
MMPKSYTDIVNAMVEARQQGKSVDKVVITDESMDGFLADDNFTKATEQRQKESIGVEWELPIETGDGNYLLTESGTRIDL